MKELATSFGYNPVGYDIYRPSYPIELFDDISSVLKLRTCCSILELGCGTGKATHLFQGLSPTQVCLDPCVNLLNICREHFGRLDTYSFVHSSFEEYEGIAHSFDLIYAATSFHWLNRKTRFTKAAELLSQSGGLAVFRDRHIRALEGFFTEVQELYQMWAPELIFERPKVCELYQEEEYEPFHLNFQSARDRELIYSSDEYIGLLQTFSGHIALGEDRLKRLCEAIHTLIETQYDGSILKVMTTHLSIFSM